MWDIYICVVKYNEDYQHTPNMCISDNHYDQESIIDDFCF